MIRQKLYVLQKSKVGSFWEITSQFRPIQVKYEVKKMKIKNFEVLVAQINLAQ